MVQRIRSRSSIGDSRSLVKPKCTRYSIEELSGDSSGAPTPAGSNALALGKALADHLPLQVRVAAAPEHDLDRGQSLARGRAHRVDVLGTGEQVLQRPRHQRLHLHGVEAGSLRLNQQVRRREVGKYVEARPDQCADAEQRDQH